MEGIEEHSWIFKEVGIEVACDKCLLKTHSHKPYPDECYDEENTNSMKSDRTQAERWDTFWLCWRWLFLSKNGYEPTITQSMKAGEIEGLDVTEIKEEITHASLI